MIIFNQPVSIKTKLTSKISMKHSFFLTLFFCVVVIFIFLSFSCLNSTIFRSLDMSLAYECQLCLCKYSTLQLTPSLPLKNKCYVHKTVVWLQSGFYSVHKSSVSTRSLNTAVTVSHVQVSVWFKC